MSKTLLVIHSHAAANEMMKLLWPFYKVGGCDMLGIGRTNSKCEWPEPIANENIGIDLFKRWEEHKSDSLCRKLIDTMEVCITKYSQYSDYCIIEWDTILTGPLPEYPGGFCTRVRHINWQHIGISSPLGMLPPWWFNADIAKPLIEEGRRMIESGDIEKGTPDIFIGKVIHRTGVPYKDIPIYFQCTICCESERIEAREHFRKKDVIAIHGIKDADTLNYIATPMILS